MCTVLLNRMHLSSLNMDTIIQAFELKVLAKLSSYEVDEMKQEKERIR